VRVTEEIGYILGLLLARGKIGRDRVTIRLPCAPDGVEGNRAFILDVVIPKIETCTGEPVRVRHDKWGGMTYVVTIDANLYDDIFSPLGFADAEICRSEGVPSEIFWAPTRIQREFLRGLADCTGVTDEYIDRRLRVIVRTLNSNVHLTEDVVELFLKVGVPLFDVNLSPAPMGASDSLTEQLERLRTRLPLELGVNVTQRQERIGRDHLIRMWVNDFQREIGFRNQWRAEMLRRRM